MGAISFFSTSFFKYHCQVLPFLFTGKNNIILFVKVLLKCNQEQFQIVQKCFWVTSYGFIFVAVDISDVQPGS